jgi:hypothetical protein
LPRYWETKARSPLEDALSRSFTSNAAKAVRIDAAGLNGDLHGSPEYRAHLVAVLPRARGRGDVVALGSDPAGRSLTLPRTGAGL